MIYDLTEAFYALKRAIHSAHSKLHVLPVLEGCAATQDGNYFIVAVNGSGADRSKLVALLRARQLDAELDGQHVRVYTERSPHG